MRKQQVLSGDTHFFYQVISTSEIVLPSSGLGDVAFCCATIIPTLEELYKFEIYALES